jgi:hypothetical protein
VKTLAWPCPAPGGSGEEFAAVAGPQHAATRVLIVPALFEEANRTRRALAQAMRLMAAGGVFAVLIDLPGTNESLAPLERQSLAEWRAATATAASHFAATHALCLRAGALVVPPDLPGWRVEPITGAQVLRPMLRAAVLSAREQGGAETAEGLLTRGRESGIELAGYRLGPTMVTDLERAAPLESRQAEVTLAELGGAALWLRSEPGDDPELAAGLARLVAGGTTA